MFPRLVRPSRPTPDDRDSVCVPSPSLSPRSPSSRSSLTHTNRFLGFLNSTSASLMSDPTPVGSMYSNSMYDDQPSVWGALTSSSFISLSFITPTPSHFLFLAHAFSVIINNLNTSTCSFPRTFSSVSCLSVHYFILSLVIIVLIIVLGWDLPFLDLRPFLFCWK